MFYEAAMRDLNHRMTVLVEAKLPKYGRFKELERLTKIKNATWQKWGRGKQRPTMEMIEAVSQLWPVNAFWLTTGEELPEVGLTRPRESASGEARNLGIATEQFLNYRQRLREEITASQAKSVLEGREPTDAASLALAEAFVKASIKLANFSQLITPTTLEETLEAAYELAVEEDKFLPELKKLWEQQVLKQLQKQHGDKQK